MKRQHNGTGRLLTAKGYAAAALLVVAATAAAVSPMVHRLRGPADRNAASSAAARRSMFASLVGELEGMERGFNGRAGILIRDLKTGEEVRINADRLIPSASLVKVPIMAAVFQANEEKRLLLTDEVALQNHHKIPDCSRLYGMPVGSKYTVVDLLERMIQESDNTATNMLVDALGFGYVNRKFVEFGLRKTDLRRGVMELKWRSGLENYTTADEMAYLLEKIYRGELVTPAASAAMLDIMKDQKVNDRIPRKLPGDLAVAHKTGLLRGTVSDCGIVFAPQGDFVVCVLTDDIKSYRTAKKFIGDVAARAYDIYRSRAAAVQAAG